MASAIQKITLSASRDIPFNKLVLSQGNVRRVKAGVSIEELAEDIARRTLLLLDVHAEDGMTLEQLMAFTVTNDHARQEQVWEGLSRSHNREAYFIRRQLTEGAVRAADRRAQFVGAEAYGAAGGTVMRDLFEHGDGGWLQDSALLDRLVIEKLQAEAETLRAEGWKWIAVAADFPYGHAAGLRRLNGETVGLTDEEDTSLTALKAEHDALEAKYAEADELPDEVDQRLGEIETAMAALEDRPVRYDTRLTVIDRVPAGDPTAFRASPGMALDAATLLAWVTAQVP